MRKISIFSVAIAGHPEAEKARMLLTMPMRGSVEFSLCHILKLIGFIRK